MIRSKDSLVSVEKDGKINLLKNNLPFDYGVNVFISLKY